jgi:UDPglucose 6-dehydrogenase
MKLVMVGSGYVGLVSGACFAEFGYQTICVDNDSNRISELNSGKCPFYEPGMDDLISKHLNTTKLLAFSNSLNESMKNADIIFITVGTPSRRLEDEADLSYVWSVAEEIGNNIKKYCLVVTKSTVPVGTSQAIKKIIQKKVSNENFDVVSNPEFLREGSAINDFMRPDRVVIGTENKKSENIMKELYRPLYLRETPLVSTSIETSEIIKYASNSFLATKIGFINEIADLCESVGANVQDVSKALGIDQRIGSKFLNAGPGYGGSCFPKDVKAFISTADKFNVNLSIVSAVHKSNKNRIEKIANKIINNTKKNDVLTILGLSFKPNTDDIRESTSIKLAIVLKERGYKVNCFDPKAMNNAKKEITDLNYFKTAFEACSGSDAIIICTEWNEFRALNFEEIGKIVKQKKIFDLRNIYNSEELEKIGYEYYGTGK